MMSRNWVDVGQTVVSFPLGHELAGDLEIRGKLFAAEAGSAADDAEPFDQRKFRRLGVPATSAAITFRICSLPFPDPAAWYAQPCPQGATAEPKRANCPSCHHSARADLVRIDL